MAIYDGHVSYFGSKEKYAQAIKDKEKSGGLSDKAAADAFKADNPGLFSGLSGGGDSGDGVGRSTSQSLRDYLGNYGVTPGWSSNNPNIVHILGKQYTVGNIPGTIYDSELGTHYVADENALSKALELENRESQQIEIPEDIRQYLQRPKFDEEAYLKNQQKLQQAQISPLLEALKLQNQQYQQTLRKTYDQKRRDLTQQGAETAEVITNIMALQGLTGEPLGKALADVSATTNAEKSRLMSNEISDLEAAINDLNSKSLQLNQQANAGALAALTSKLNQESAADEQNRFNIINLLTDLWKYQGNREQQNKQLAMTEAGLTGLYNGLPTLAASISKEKLPLELALLQSQINENNRPKGTGTKVSDTDIKRENLSNAQTWAYNKLKEGYSLAQLEADIIAKAGQYTAMGIDPYDLIDYAWYVKTGAKKPKVDQQTNEKTSAGILG